MCSRAGEYSSSLIFGLDEFAEWEQEWWNRVHTYYEKHG